MTHLLSYLILLLFAPADAVLLLARVGGVFPAQPRLRPLLQRRQFLSAAVVVVLERVGGGGGGTVDVATVADVVVAGIVFLLLSLQFNKSINVILNLSYRVNDRVTHQVIPNLPLTLKQNLRFSTM